MIGTIVVGLVLLGIGLVSIFGGKGGPGKKENKSGFNAQNNAQRVTFLESYGWDVSDEPIEVCEIILPESFDDVFKRYNELQKTQGLDLAKYKGRRAKRWTYMVLNYPSDDEVHANVIICDDKIIAGDICSVALGGFIHGFSADEAEAFAEHGLLAQDLPEELNGIGQIERGGSGQSASSQAAESSDSAQQGASSSAASSGSAAQDNAQDNAQNSPTNEIIDEVEQQTKQEIENALQMLLEAAEDKAG